MPAKYIYDSHSSTKLLSESFEILIPGSKVECTKKNNKFKSYGDGIIDENFYLGNFATEYMNTILVQNSSSYLLSIPIKGKYFIDTSNDKNIEISEKHALIVFPTDKVLYHSSSDYTDGYDIYVQKKIVNQILDNKYNMPVSKPDFILLDINNTKVKSLIKFIDSTLSSLRSFPDIRNTQFVKRSIQEVSTFMIADIIAENLKATPITINHPYKYLVSRVERIIINECAILFTIDEIANKLFTSTRNIQLAFKKHRDYTPMQFLRTQKLYLANKTIIKNSNVKITVKEIALGVGMPDLNRFSKYYANTFGELPSETIRKSQK